MTEVRLERLLLNNYKCFAEYEVDFGEKTRVRGRNRVGKTTLMDAFFDVMTGKLSNGAEPAGIRPHDAEGKEIEKVECIREVVLTVNDSPVDIKKIDYQKWVRPRGEIEEVFKGNGTKYEVDGIPFNTYASFKEWMQANIAPVEDILLACNPQYFLEKLRKSSAEGRKILEVLSGFDSAAFTAGHEEAISLIGKHTADEALKALRSSLNKQKEKLEKKNTEIAYETGRQIEEVTEEDTALKEKLEHEYEELSAALEIGEGQTNEYKDLVSAVLVSQQKRDTYLNKKKEENRKERESRYAKLKDAQLTIESNTKRLAKCQSDLEDTMQAIKNTQAKMAELGEEWKKQKALQFNEEEAVCPYCGQRLTGEKLEEVKAEFEKKKAGVLTKIEDDGNRLKRNVKELQQDIKSIAETQEGLKEKIKLLKTRIENGEFEMPDEYKPEKDELLKEFDEAYKVASERMEAFRAKAENLNKTKEEFKVVSGQLSDITHKIDSIKANKEMKEKQLARLKAELSEIAQGAADIERQIKLVMDYSLEKNQIIEKEVNSHFKHFQFKFLEFTQEGNPVEVCKMMVDGTAYSGLLNGGDRRLAELDLCCGIQEMLGVSFPVWMDEAGTVDKWRIPETKQQLILLEYAENPQIEVEVE